ncbi:zinc/iron-chelating domain-containing protein [Pseudoalteromonas sp. NBT06-2]|uniref:YkgJ family cysteine cluster protein n=1 Tax=Pseudoalteromonas sp. NBT06-2 TaxID=2025950 RepID=UPI000BA4FACB|nr:YkgJ family cysteine cluster protein [Pseudoalteromonas sp. NBT06-2]PAJ75287.1 zinc/iron-chelating domain-containing protein [Pseudoalteromonas sp. NBT06-2]
MKECNQCGKCCMKYGGADLSVTMEEIDMWELFQPHIFEYVKNGKVWFDPQTNKQLSTCPFLETMPKSKLSKQVKYTCGIYLDRPEDCRHYPISIAEMVRDECEMIESIDIENPKRAQTKLDILMVDSRPPYCNF